MASLEKQKGHWRIVFRVQGQKFQRALDTTSEREAKGLKARVEENLKLLSCGRLSYNPETDDLVTILLSDGRLNSLPSVQKPVTLGRMLKDYRQNPPVGKEDNTRYTERIHIKHLLRIFGRRTLLKDVPERLQRYVDARAAEGLSQATIRKELSSLSSIWNRWALRQKLVPGPLTLRNLEYPKGTVKPPFQTWDQIAEKIAQDESPDLWDSLYLTTDQIEELLVFVANNGSRVKGHQKFFPFVYPMVAFCAHTGARRSEMLRSRRSDFDFKRNEVVIREKKKDTSKKETYRHVPMTPLLREAMLQWFQKHPGGEYAFCKKRGEPLTVQMATHYLRWSLDETKWEVIRGWHCLRHSFVSNMASSGVDQRVIMNLVGHLNPETTRRYQHLLPSTVQDAVALVFGKRKLTVSNAG
jgi:integrase